MDLDAYQLDDAVYDEMFDRPGACRGPWRPLGDALGALSAEDLGAIQERVAYSFTREGISFIVYSDDRDEERIIPVDCLPRILPAAEWEGLERGLGQRLRALNLFLDDVYGARRIIDDGVVPADIVDQCPQYRRQLRGIPAPGGVRVGVCGSDIVRTHDGFMVLEDNLRVPSGVSYMIANRRAVKAGLRLLYRGLRVREVEHYGRLLRRTLCELAPPGVEEPTVALLSPGIYNSAFYEHMFLAREIGASLVEGRDLVVRDGVVHMRTTTGLERVDVIYRRIDDDFMDPQVFRPDSMLGTPGLVEAWARGNVSLVNAPGTGVADDKGVYAFVPDMIRYYLGEEPALANVETRLCRRPEDLEYTLDNLERLVVKRVGESGGYGMLVGPASTAGERDAYARQVRADPADFISQPVLALSRAPCLVDGRIEPRHVDLRPFMLQGAETRIVPGALCRVALERGSLVVNSSQGGGGKDFWVVEA